MTTKTQELTRDSIYEIIAKSGAKMFSVNFIKKDGSSRKMVCRKGVTKGVKGTGVTVLSSNLIRVFDMNHNGFRTINADTISSIKVKGILYTIID